MHGIIGAIGRKGRINECYNIAQIIQKDNETNSQEGYVGGIASYLGWDGFSQINNSYNIGEISCNGKWVSGISTIGRGGIINNCYNAGDIIVENAVYHKYIGGIASSSYYDPVYGKAISVINNSYNLADVKLTGNVIASDDDANRRSIGGIIGEISNGYIEMENNYNKGEVTTIAYGGYVGGICARIRNEETHIILRNCSTTATSSIGINQNSNAFITNVNANVTNMPNVLDVINKDNNAFVEDNENINKGYPLLRWQIENYKKQ